MVGDVSSRFLVKRLAVEVLPIAIRAGIYDKG